MSDVYVMRQASEADLDAVMLLLDQRIAWLRAQGSDQWNAGHTFRNRLDNSIARGETWLLEDGRAPVATATVNIDGDPDFWTPSELQDAALYLGKMATSLARRGEGLGALVITWTTDYAARRGLDRVRWDVWRTNARLQQYYREIGASHVRTVEAADRWSGALFELSASRVPSLHERIITRPLTGTSDADPIGK